jgi:hypothetical protein
VKRGQLSLALALSVGSALIAQSEWVTAVTPAITAPHTYPRGVYPPGLIAAVANMGGRTHLEQFVANAQGEILSVEALHKDCDQSFAAYRVENDTAYEAWKTKQKSSLDLIDRSSRAVILRNSLGDKALASKVKDYYRAQVGALVQNQYRDKAIEFEATCKLFSRVLQQPHFDLDSKYAADLAALRAHPIEGPATQPK